MSNLQDPTVGELFPKELRSLLSGSGRDFVEQVGIEVVRDAVLHILMGDNLRNHTEPLTRRRIAMISGGLVMLFARGHVLVNDFENKLSEMALNELRRGRTSDKAAVWLGQWLLGLTGKSVQNVLKSDQAVFQGYIREFETVIRESALKCLEELGDLRMILQFGDDSARQQAELNWESVARLTTVIGSQTLTIRGSDKAVYGKLFEKLVLGSVLTILGFERIDIKRPAKNNRGVFWLTDSSSTRESDATLILRPGKVIRFDIGFIGPGNSEISKDKLSRYAQRYEAFGNTNESITFIVVDRLPKTGKTETAAQNIGAEIIQMSLQFWPRLLAHRLHTRLGFEHEILNVPDNQMPQYLSNKLETIPILDFLSGLVIDDIASDEGLTETINEIEILEDQLE